MSFKLKSLSFLITILFISWSISPVLCRTKNLVFSGCDRNGWRCAPAKIVPEKYDLEYECDMEIQHISIALWGFRAPTHVYGLKLANCSYLEVDLTCGLDGHIIDSLYIYNIETLNLTTSLHNELSYLPNKFVLDNIRHIDKLPPYILKKRMNFPPNLHKCIIEGRPINTLFFTDIGEIKLVEHHAISVSDMEWFSWNNVTIREVEAMGIKVEMEKGKQVTIKNSRFDKIGYQSFNLKAHSVFINSSEFREIEKSGVTATTYWFDLANSKIGVVHPYGFHILSQNINIINNSFTQLKTRALSGIGPGLLDNAVVSIGRLRFTYLFSKNKIIQANVGSLNPDWEAYKSLKTFLNFTLNHLPCACYEVGWVTQGDGMGTGFNDMVSFNHRLMEKKSQNMCLDAPCLLPFGVIALTKPVNGSCANSPGMEELCYEFINNKDFRMRVLAETEKFPVKKIPNLVINEMDPNFIIHAKPVQHVLQKDPEFIVNVKPLKKGLYNEDREKKLKKESFDRGFMYNYIYNPSDMNFNEAEEFQRISRAIENNTIFHKETKQENDKESEVLPHSQHIQQMHVKIKRDPMQVEWNLLDSPESLTAGNDFFPDIKQSDNFYSSDNAKLSIHEQINNIADKLAKESEMTVQERQKKKPDQKDDDKFIYSNTNIEFSPFKSHFRKKSLREVFGKLASQKSEETTLDTTPEDNINSFAHEIARVMEGLRNNDYHSDN